MLALRAAVGLAVCGHVLFFLALAGWLKAAAMIGLVVVGVWECGSLLPPWIAQARLRAAANCRNPWRRQAAALLVLLVPLFLMALRPPIAFDETLYHLPFVRALAESGQLRFLADMRFPVFPQLHELLCVPIYIFAGDTATHLVALAELTIAAALLFEWSGPLAAAFFLGSPIVIHLGTITYVDMALTLFVAAGFYCLEHEGNEALAGFFFGTACSVKYLGGYFAVAALILVIVRRRKFVAFAAACFAAAIPTTLWLFLTTGNPLFPYYGSSAWAVTPPPATALEHVTRIVRVLYDVTFARDRVNFAPPVTPFLIVAVALMIKRRVWWVVAIGAGYLVVFAFLFQDTRYLLPLLPIVAATLKDKQTYLPAIAIAPGVLYLAWTLAVRGLPPLTPAAREAFLTARVPEYRALMRAGDEPVYVCGAEQLKFYARGRLLGDHVGPYSFSRIIDTGAFATTGAHYYLVAKRVCRAPAGMQLVYEDEAAQLWRIKR